MRIKQFTINAERSCGTRYIEKLFYSAFGLPFTRKLGYKHFFGTYDEQIVEAVDTLLIGIARNPYDWLMALFKNKHHLPFLYGKDIYLYLTAEWYSVEHRHTDWYENETQPDHPKEIFTDRDWDTGARYKNIFALRRKKLLYLQKLYQIAPNYVFFRFEDVMAMHHMIVRTTAHRFELPIVSKDYPTPHNKKPYKIPYDIKEIIDTNIDWDVEAVFGYEKNRRKYIVENWFN